MRDFLTRLVRFGLVLTLACGASYLCNLWLLGFEAISLPSQATTLVIGDSYARNGLNPRALGGAVSVAQDAEPAMLTGSKLDHILNTNPQIETVVWGLGPHTFAQYNDTKLSTHGQTFAMFRRYYPLMTPGAWWDLGVTVAPREWTIMLMGHWLVPDRHLLRDWIRAEQNALEHRQHPYVGGFSSRSSAVQADTVDARAVVLQKYPESSWDDPVSDAQTTHFRALVDGLNNRDVRLLLVSTPMHPAYRRAMPPAIVDHFESDCTEPRPMLRWTGST